MKKMISMFLALMTCALLTAPALAAEEVGAIGSGYAMSGWSSNGPYTYVTGPWTGSYWNGVYWNGNNYVVSPWNGDYYYYVGPSNSAYVNGTWNPNSWGLSNFKKVRTYSAKTYKDVPAGAWYESAVKTLYEMGIATEGANFRPNSGMTINEVISLAVRLHSTYNNWSIPAGMTELQYALNVGIIAQGQYDNYSAPATRRSFAAIMAKAFPSEALRGINVIMDGSIPDVPANDPGASGIYTLYRAGILTGSNAYGSFSPNSRITRASAAVITARMVDSTQRKTISLLNPEATSISLDWTSLVLYPGQTRTLHAYIYPLSTVNQSVYWSSSDYTVATVDASGNVTTHQPGTAIITATTVYGARATCLVEVTGGF